jgi:beta-phosphoglucomutase family hydrolase
MNISLILPPEPYAALIFDCDGTLADSMPTHYQAWVDTLRSFGAELDEDHFYSMGGVPTDVIIRRLNEQFGYGLDVDRTFAAKEQRFAGLIHTVEEIEAVANIARINHGKTPMAVASGGARAIVEETLRSLGLRSLFDTVVTQDDVIHGKPAPDIYLLAAERLGVAPEECVVYEDAEPGFVGARAAGMRVVDVRVLWGGANARTG